MVENTLEISSMNGMPTFSIESPAIRDPVVESYHESKRGEIMVMRRNEIEERT